MRCSKHNEPMHPSGTWEGVQAYYCVSCNREARERERAAGRPVISEEEALRREAKIITDSTTFG